MVNLDIYLWEQTCLIYQKEKPSLIPIENFSETDIIKMIQSLTRYLIRLVHEFVKDIPMSTYYAPLLAC